MMMIDRETEKNEQMHIKKKKKTLARGQTKDDVSVVYNISSGKKDSS